MYKTLDLFAGAGGLSLGFIKTGMFEIVAAAEINKDAQKTYLFNHENSNIKMIDDVRNCDFASLAKKLDRIDIIIGGPPCQGFSNANRQKNHVVSLNNRLVKEYFRAIAEIKPLAFVMENVGMLASDTHRFYDSNIDHDKVIEMKIQMRDDQIQIAKTDYEGIDLLRVIKDNETSEYKIPNAIFQLLNVLYKNTKNEKRLKKYIEKNRTKIVKCIDELFDNKAEKICQFTAKRFKIILEGLKENHDTKEYFIELKEVVELQKSLNVYQELRDNQLRYELEYASDEGEIIANVKSYAVNDYIESILGDEYSQKGETINSLWYGVPQERKRHIVLGIRKDLVKGDVYTPKQPEQFKIITVGDAIFDLQIYQPSFSVEHEVIQLDEKQKSLSEYAKSMRNSEVLHNHIITKSTERALERFEALKEGDNFHKLDDRLKSTYSDPKRTQNTIYLRLNSDQPSGTVVNVRKSMWIHPKINRAISVREAARLQSFPDNFIFYGAKDSQYQQVGNAVPPLMAEGIAKCLLEQLVNK